MTEDQVIEQQVVESSEPEIAQQVVQAQQDEQERNWRQLREAAQRAEEDRRRAERERDEALQLVRQMHNKIQPDTIEEHVDLSIDDSALVEGKHLSAVQKHIKNLEAQLKNYQQQTTAQTAETRLRSQYNDFDSVVNENNVKTLQSHYPELYATMTSSGDLYNKAVTAYTMIKNLNIGTQDPYASDRARVAQNAAKPRPIGSLNSTGDTPLAKAAVFDRADLTDELKAQLLKEMNAAKRNYNGPGFNVPPTAL